jgi:P27 family predicted phage terminase small subunit
VVGTAIWSDIWQSMPVLSTKADLHSVTRYCEAADDSVRARVEVEKRGLLIDEPMTDPRGGILGLQGRLKPAEAGLRRADKVVTELGDRLGLTPAARARLGLVISQAELAGAEAGRILSSMFVPDVMDIEEDKR